MQAFRRRSIVVFAILLATFSLHLFWPEAVKWLFPVASWGGILHLTVKAVRRRGAFADLDMEIASETLQTYGLISTVLTIVHVFIAVVVNFTGDITSLQKHVWDIAAPFAEGLIASGFGVFSSNYVSQLDVATHGRSSGGSGGGSGGFSLDPATSMELAKLRTNLEAFNRAAEEAARNTSDLNRLLKQVGSLIESLNKFFAASGKGGSP